MTSMAGEDSTHLNIVHSEHLEGKMCPVSAVARIGLVSLAHTHTHTKKEFVDNLRLCE